MSRREACEVAIRSLTRGDGARQLRQPRVERRLRRRNVRDPPAQALGGRVEVLEPDQMLEVRKHQDAEG